jgi:hypothetical protein
MAKGACASLTEELLRHLELNVLCHSFLQRTLKVLAPSPLLLKGWEILPTGWKQVVRIQKRKTARSILGDSRIKNQISIHSALHWISGNLTREQQHNIMETKLAQQWSKFNFVSALRLCIAHMKDRDKVGHMYSTNQILCASLAQRVVCRSFLQCRQWNSRRKKSPRSMRLCMLWPIIPDYRILQYQFPISNIQSHERPPRDRLQFSRKKQRC